MFYNREHLYWIFRRRLNHSQQASKIFTTLLLYLLSPFHQIPHKPLIVKFFTLRQSGFKAIYSWRFLGDMTDPRKTYPAKNIKCNLHNQIVPKRTLKILPAPLKTVLEIKTLSGYLRISSSSSVCYIHYYVHYYFFYI